MSFIKEDSEECSTSPLEWFKVAPTQTVIEKSSDIEHQSLTSLRDNASIEFFAPAATEEYYDLQNSRLYIKCRILRNNGQAITADDVVAPINDLHNSLWSNVELSLNDRLVSHSNNTHGHTSMISHLIHDSEESLLSERAMRMLFKDTPKQMDVFDPRRSNPNHLIPGFDIERRVAANGDVTYHLIDAAVNTGNHGLYQRYCLSRLSQEIEMIGPLRIDMFEQERYLPSGVSIRLRFHRQKNLYTLMSEDPDYKIDIMDAFLLMRKVRPSPGVQLGHHDALLKMAAKFPITRKECKVVSVAAGLRDVKKDNLFLGQLPKRVVVAMVDSDAFAGVQNKNPYNFKHNNVSHIQLYTDGEPVRSRPLRPVIGSRNYLHCYETLYRGLNRMDGEKSSIIKRVDWDKGYSLFAFDLTPDMDAEDHYALIKHGNLRLELEFAEALADPVSILIYAEFDNIVEITADRHIQIDYV